MTCDSRQPDCILGMLQIRAHHADIGAEGTPGGRLNQLLINSQAAPFLLVPTLGWAQKYINLRKKTHSTGLVAFHRWCSLLALYSCNRPLWPQSWMVCS